MIEEPALKAFYGSFHLCLGDHRIEALGDAELATLQTAVAMLRTLFEDHYVDPEHQSCLFFHGCTIAGGERVAHDFTVVHRGGRVVLSDFTFPWQGPACVSLPLKRYTTEVLRFTGQVQERGRSPEERPEWQQQYVDSLWHHLNTLTVLGHQFLIGRCEDRVAYCEQFHMSHGYLKRPLELQIGAVLEDAAPFAPVVVQSRVAFGPIHARQVLPMRLNRGDVVRVSVREFTRYGAILTLEGVGSGGVRPGDRLFGMQLFYP